jgi:glutamate racemase
MFRSGMGLVEIVENLQSKNSQTTETLKNLLSPILMHDVDHLVLGCTHYPFLLDQIQEIVGNNVKVVDPAPAIAKQLKNVLEEHKLLSNLSSSPEYNFYTSGNLEILDKFVKSECVISGFETHLYRNI